MAKEKGLDIGLIPGSGPGGRITREDVLNFKEGAAPTREAVGIPASPEPEQVIKRTGMRRIIARKMLESTTEVAAQTYMSNSVDATAIQDYRKQLLPYAEKKANVRVTITDILMKITAFALKEHPIINSKYTEDGDILKGDVHMGMAMAVAEGLIVPVIWNADKKSIIQIAQDRVSLIERGRAGKLTPDDIKGSTFTLSALGMYGIEEFAAIINQPENGILAVATIIDKPWVVDGQLTIRPIMKVNLTYDHRTIYGVDAADFMATLKLFIENPLMVLA
jgi:pyruvate dehydrogenase E2 component (dihydrolipoamide acetyltransferase)